MDNAWRWFFSGILIGAICAGLAVIVIDPAGKLGLHTDSPASASTATGPGAVERTFVMVVDEEGRVISQRTELKPADELTAPIAPAAPDSAAPGAPAPPPAPTPTIHGLGKPVMAKVEQPLFLSARDGVAYVASRGLQVKRVNLKGEVSNQPVEGIRDLGGSRVVEVDVIADGTLYALVVDGSLEWRLFRRAAGANAWTLAASASSTAWPADVVALAVTDGGAVYLSATDPGGVFRLEADMTTLRPWVEGGRVFGLDTSGDDTRLLYAAPEANPSRPAEQIRAVLGGAAQRWLSAYDSCPGADGQPRRAPLVPRDVAILPIVEGIDPALVVDSNHVVWYQERFGEGEPLFGVPCESGADASHLSDPRAVAIDNLGNVFISDSGNARVVVLPKPGATPAPTPKGKTAATPPPAPTATPAPPSTIAGAAPAPLTFVEFGNPSACPTGRCPEADVMLPPNVTVRAGEAVRFNVRAQSHQVAVYAPGTALDAIDRAAIGGLEGTPGANRVVVDPRRRVAFSPTLPFEQPAIGEWDFDTRGLAPGAYLVICTFAPHLDTGMMGTVVVQ